MKKPTNEDLMTWGTVALTVASSILVMEGARTIHVNRKVGVELKQALTLKTLAEANKAASLAKKYDASAAAMQINALKDQLIK